MEELTNDNSETLSLNMRIDGMSLVWLSIARILKNISFLHCYLTIKKFNDHTL